MKKRIYSWLLAGAYLAWGVLLFLAVPRLQAVVSGFNILTTSLIRAVLAFGPNGCLFLAMATGIAIILNAEKFHRRFVSLFFTITLLLWVYCLADFALTQLNRQMT